MMTREMSPIQKATSSLEGADLELVLRFIRLLPQLRRAPIMVEVRQLRHTGWRISIVERQEVNRTETDIK